MDATKENLAKIARHLVQMNFHGYIDGEESNLQPIIKLFPKWNIVDADKLWCAAFVYYCVRQAGFDIPYSPDECETCSLAGCGGWEEFAIKNPRVEYHRERDFTAQSGDIVLFDRVFNNSEHDHIGIVLEVSADTITVAEGNTSNSNISAVVNRPIDEHIRGYIRIPDGFKYFA